MNRSGKIWFPAKKYGWGWGPPCTWQGWVVMGAYLLLMAGSAALFLPGQHVILFFLSVWLWTSALVLISWWKGEPPRWRWGD